MNCFLFQEFFLNEEHPLSLNLSLSISLSLVPVILSIETAGCSLPTEQARETEQSSMLLFSITFAVFFSQNCSYFTNEPCHSCLICM